MHYVWRAPLAFFLLYRELFSDHELFTDRELCDARTLLALFLLYHELFSNHELFFDPELHDTGTSDLPYVTHALHVESSTHTFSIVPQTLF